MEKQKCTCLLMLPEGCIADIFALTTPPDVCRISLVSPFLRSVADSDSVWAKFLPSDYQSIIARSSTPIPEFRSLKELYVYLSHNPLLIDQGRKSFSLEKWTGKKCYFLGARDLTIIWGSAPEYWRWTSLPESRFPEVALLKIVWWFDICGKIRAGILSPRTSYTAYFVYKLKNDNGSFHNRRMEVSVGISGVDESKNVRLACLRIPERLYKSRYIHNARMGVHGPDDQSENLTFPKRRDDGWFELEMGEFFTGNEDDCIELKMQNVKCGEDKRGLVVEGIEIRPTLA